MHTPSIQSEGDLEIVILHETHGLLAEIIGPELYELRGSHGDQYANFRSRAAFKWFLTLSIELVAEGAKSVYIDAKFQNWSLLKGLEWLAAKYPVDARDCGLDTAVRDLSAWFAHEIPIDFWCPDVDRQIALQLSFTQLISFAANSAKHHLLRVTELIAKLDRVCTKAGHHFTPQQLVSVLDNMTEEIRSKLTHHATHFLEYLGKLFLSINRIIWIRFIRNPTNHVARMDHPADVTSEIFRNMYGSVLVFKRYDEARITDYTPSTFNRPGKLGDAPPMP